jgi:hypothetical protein
MENLPPDMASAQTPTSSAAVSPAVASATGDVSPSPPLTALPQDNRREGLRAVGVAVVCLLFWQITLHIHVNNAFVVWLTTLIYLPLTLLLTVQTARALLSRRALTANLILSALLVLPAILVPVLYTRFPNWAGWSTLGPGFGMYMRFLIVTGLQGLVMVWLAASVGALLSRLVREIKILLPMAVALACVDLYVVFGGGLVTQAKKGNAPAKVAMQALTVKMPTTHPVHGVQPMQFAVGFADYLFVALFFACFARFALPLRSTLIVLCGTLMGYMILVGLTGWDLPALVPIAIVVISMNWRQFRYERSEAFALLYAGLIVAALAGGFYFFAHR